MQSSRELKQKVQQYQRTEDFQASRNISFSQKTQFEKEKLKTLKKEWKDENKTN